MRVELQRGGCVINNGALNETFAAVTVTLKLSVVVTYTVGGIESTYVAEPIQLGGAQVGMVDEVSNEGGSMPVEWTDVDTLLCIEKDSEVVELINVEDLLRIEDAVDDSDLVLDVIGSRREDGDVDKVLELVHNVVECWVVDVVASVADVEMGLPAETLVIHLRTLLDASEVLQALTAAKKYTSHRVKLTRLSCVDCRDAGGAEKRTAYQRQYAAHSCA